MSSQPSVLGIVLAGGAGTRLSPLTEDRAKPAVPFGGMYRLIDFALSNLVNCGMRRICVLTQYKSHSLDRHISTTWRMSSLLGGYVTPVPAQQRRGPRWYTGSADAIYQSMNLINDEEPDLVLVVGADHVYRMDPLQMIAAHVASGAGVTVAANPVPLAEARAFGIIAADASGRIEAFREKPKDPPPMPGDPSQAYASMGNYVFSTSVLKDALRRDAADPKSKHDLGGNLVPMLVAEGKAYAYDFSQNQVPGEPDGPQRYWRDVGTVDSYFEAHLDLCQRDPLFSLYNAKWPILTYVPPLPPAKFLDDGPAGRPGHAVASLISNGVIIAGGLVRESVLSPGVRVEAGAQVERAVLLHGTRVGRSAVVRDVICDKNVVIPDGARIGVDKERDLARGFTVSPAGITVLGKGTIVADG